MKTWLLPAGEDWICDRLVQDWYEWNADISTQDPHEADVIWLLSDWRWKEVARILRGKKVMTTVHHIVPEKFGPTERTDFRSRDDLTDVYHVYNERVFDFIRPLTSKPIHLIPYWANQNIWKKSDLTQEELRKKHGLPIEGHLIGSFQRDTEGSDLRSPKLEKGPDLLVEYIDALRDFKFGARPHLIQGGFKPSELHVVLAGWRRQYVIGELEKLGIAYTYFERPKQEILNELYQTLDCYVVAARCEGGPQALIECGLTGTPVISRPVGIAEQVLPPTAINTRLFSTFSAIPDVSKMLLPHGFEGYRKLLKEIAG